MLMKESFLKSDGLPIHSTRHLLARSIDAGAKLVKLVSADYL